MELVGLDLGVSAGFVAAGVGGLRARAGLVAPLTVAFGLVWSARLLPPGGPVAPVATAVAVGVLVHLVATLPDGRVRNPAQRVAVAAGYLLVAPLTAMAGPWPLAAAWVGVLGVAVTGWWRAGAVLRRRALPVVLGAGPAALGAVLVQHEPVAAALLLGWPVALLVGLLRDRLDRAAVADLVAELRLGTPDPGQLRAVLARALHDPSVELLDEVPDAVGVVERRGRAITPLERDGSRVGALVHDPALAMRPELLRAVAAGVAVVLENGRLDAEIHERVREVEQSRARIVRAADAARARVERDLQDGVQQQLAAVTLVLRLAQARLGTGAGDEVGAALDEAGRELAAALAALRELAGGLYPVLLSDAGLGPALGALAERAEVAVVLGEVPRERLPEPVEQAGYFVVAEVLDRAARLGGVREVRVAATVSDGRLHLVVVHDGHDTAPMHGPADRVGALDGELAVRHGAVGTTVAASVPVGKTLPAFAG